MPVYGPNNWGTGANDTADGGTVAWSGTPPGTAFWSGTAVSNYLKLTNFGFSIPDPGAGYGVQTISASLEFSISVSGGSFGVRDNSVKLLLAGSFAGKEQSAAGVWGGAANSYPNDGSDQVWGPDTLYTDVNNVGFGIAVQGVGTAPSSGGTATLSSATITVTIGLIDFVFPPLSISTDSQVIGLRRSHARPTPVAYRCAAMRGPVFRQTRTLRFAKPLPLFRAAA